MSIESHEAWQAWLDGADDRSVQFNVYPGEDVVEAGASALGVPVSEAVNVERMR